MELNDSIRPIYVYIWKNSRWRDENKTSSTVEHFDFFPCKFEYPGITFPRNKPPHQSSFLSHSRRFLAFLPITPSHSRRNRHFWKRRGSMIRKITTRCVVIINSSINFKTASHFHRVRWKLAFHYGEGRKRWFRFLGNWTREKLVAQVNIYLFIYPLASNGSELIYRFIDPWK